MNRLAAKNRQGKLKLEEAVALENDIRVGQTLGILQSVSGDTIRNHRPTFVRDAEPARKLPTLDRQYWLAPRATCMSFSLTVTVSIRELATCSRSAASSQTRCSQGCGSSMHPVFGEASETGVHSLPNPFPPRRSIHQSSQFSTRKPGTLSNSVQLADKRSAWLTSAVAAIFRSLEPIRSFCRRRSSNRRAAASSNGTISNSS
jgi:hypothetical protein